MKKFNKIVSCALMLGVLMSTGVTAFAATNTIEPSKIESIQRDHRGSRQKKFERPKLTEEQKAQMVDTMKEKLSKHLEDGNITQEQYDLAISDILDGKKPRCLGDNKGKDGFRHMERPEKPLK